MSVRVPTLVVAAVLVATLGGCATLNQLQLRMPRVELRQMHAVSADINGLLAEGTLFIDNPNSFPINLDGFTWELSLAGKPAVTGASAEQLIIPAGGDVRVPLQFRAPYTALVNAGVHLLRSRELPYEVEVVGRFKTMLGVIRVPLTHEGTFKLPSFVPRLPGGSIWGS